MTRCGATLVHNGPDMMMVLTAAHCTSLPNLTLICGGYYLDIDKDYGTQTFQDGYSLNIISVNAHEDYGRGYINDIALIFAEVKVNENLCTVSLKHLFSAASGWSKYYICVSSKYG